MALKFRRGTTAQQSGSLAFGEPYVNTTLGTLLIGGTNGDIVLSAGGTGSTGNFGAISGSGLDITGNANIAGNLTLGGAITIGDAAADTVNVIASLSSSLIPSTTNVFDLGSASKIWRDLYISTGSIKFVDGTSVVKEFDLATLTNLEAATGSSNIAIANLNITTASLNTSVSNLNTFSESALTRLSVLEVETSNLESFTSSINTTIKSKLDTDGVVSGSSQVIGILSSLNTYTGSNDTTNTTQNSRLDQLSTASGSAITRLTALEVSASTELSTSNAQATSITNLNAFSSSQLGKDATLAIYTASVDSRLDQLSTASGSTISRLTALEVETLNLEGFTSSINTTIKSKLDTDGVVSGSSQITLSSTTGFSAYSTSVDSRILTEKGRVDAILSAADADKDSFAEIVTLINSVDTANDASFASFFTASTGRLNNLESTSASVNTSVSNLNTFSGSALTRLSALEVETANLEGFTSSINTTIKGRLNAETVVSGSSQISGLSNAQLTNSSITIGSTSTALGATSTTLAGLTSVSSTGFTGALTGNASTATTLQTARTIGGVSFDGSANINLPGVNASGNQNTTGNAATATTLATARLINGTSFDGSANITIANLVSGSSQIAHDSTTGYVANRHIDHTAVTITAGSGLSGGGDISATRTLSIATGGVTNAMLEGSIANNKLTNSTISGIALGSNLATLTIGTGLSGTSYNGSTGITIANTGVTSNVAGTGVSVSGATGAVTISIGQSVATSANAQFNSLGIGMAASATAGRIDATNDIVAFSSSDIRFKENITPIENALDKISKISGNTYDWKEENKIEHGYEGNDVGVIAQEIEAVLPQLVQTRENGFKAVKYDKLVALLIQGIKEQQIQIEELKAKIGL